MANQTGVNEFQKILNATFVNDAIEKGEYLHAARGIQDVNEIDASKAYWDRLALKIVENPDWLSKSRSFSTYAQGLYASVIPLLIGKKKFTDAEIWAQRIYAYKEKNDWLNKINAARLGK